MLGLARDTGGGYAERVVVDDEWLFDLPDEASFEEGAAFLMAFLTAWIPLTRQADARPGHARAGHRRGGRHGGRRRAGRATARRRGRRRLRERGEARGGARVGRGRSRDVRRAFLAASRWTWSSTSSAASCSRPRSALLRPLGVAIGIGFAGGWWQPVDPALLVGRNIGVQGFYLGRLMRHRPEVVRAAATDLLRMWRQGLLHPTVGATFPLAEAAAAHRLIEERRSTGKVVLVP